MQSVMDAYPDMELIQPPDETVPEPEAAVTPEEIEAVVTASTYESGSLGHRAVVRANQVVEPRLRRKRVRVGAGTRPLSAPAAARRSFRQWHLPHGPRRRRRSGARRDLDH